MPRLGLGATIKMPGPCLDADIAFAASVGVRGTPVFLVAGRKVEGGRSPEMIQAMLQSVRQADGVR